MNRERARQQRETLDRFGRPTRARDAGGKPTHRSRAQADEHYAALPCAHEHLVEFVRAPDRDQIAHRAAPHVHDVLLEHELRQRTTQIAEAKQR